MSEQLARGGVYLAMAGRLIGTSLETAAAAKCYASRLERLTGSTWSLRYWPRHRERTRRRRFRSRICWSPALRPPSL